MGAYLLTGSVALYSDALESVINVAAALAAWWALRIAALPADEGHPYGHTKAEYLSAVAEGVLIVLAALGILREALPALLAPQPVSLPPLGLALSVAATLINGGWALRLLREGRQLGSPALLADGQHLLSDVVTSAGVLLGIGLALVTGWHFLDPLLAAAVALHILWNGGQLVAGSVGGLMDAGVDAPTQAHICELVRGHGGGALEIHDLKTRSAGRLTFIEFHLVVPAQMTVEAAHGICDRLEDALAAELGGVRVTIHVEPQQEAKAERGGESGEAAIWLGPG
ncbi:cation diffusion facilitator family transporter [Deinococcus lacus]|uniref:Cation diffusion facilitator family transporter n=1 Tax=Deinococcus lacus TaxID=392561 RepID=A0ABW1YDZ4_9DEIO